MTPALQPFLFDECLVRVIADEHGAPWFVAKDVCGALGITWKGAETLVRIPDAWKGVRKFRTPSAGDRGGGEQDLVILSEPALYKLAFRSHKAEADRFTNWVASDVLPAIRRTGRYEAAEAADTPALPVRDPDMSGTAGALALVRTCERLWGRAEARALWAQLGLPVPEVPARPGRAAPGRAAMPASAWETRAHDGRIAAAFLAACTRPDPDGSIASSVLFQAFGRWSRGQDIGRWDTRRFAAALTGLGYRKYKKDVVLWLGFALAGPAA